MLPDRNVKEENKHPTLKPTPRQVVLIKMNCKYPDQLLVQETTSPAVMRFYFLFTVLQKDIQWVISCIPFNNPQCLRVWTYHSRGRQNKKITETCLHKNEGKYYLGFSILLRKCQLVGGQYALCVYTTIRKGKTYSLLHHFSPYINTVKLR